MSEAFYTAAAHAFEDVEVSTPAEAGPSSMGDAAATLDAAFDIEGTARLILDGGYKTVSYWSGVRLWAAVELLYWSFQSVRSAQPKRPRTSVVR